MMAGQRVRRDHTEDCKGAEDEGRRAESGEKVHDGSRWFISSRICPMFSGEEWSDKSILTIEVLWRTNDAL